MKVTFISRAMNLTKQTTNNARKVIDIPLRSINNLLLNANIIKTGARLERVKVQNIEGWMNSLIFRISPSKNGSVHHPWPRKLSLSEEQKWKWRKTLKSKLGYAEVKVSENKISESETGSSYSMNSYGGVIARWDVSLTSWPERWTRILPQQSLL